MSSYNDAMSHGVVVADAIVVPHVVLQLLLPHHARCCGHYCRAALCCGYGRHATCGVTVAVVVPCGAVITVVPCVVSWSQSSCYVLQLLLPCHVWCHGCCRWAALCRGHCCHATCGVMVTIVTLCGAVVTVAPHVVSWSQSLRCGVMVMVAVVVLLVPQLQSSLWWHCCHDWWLHCGRP